MHGWCVCMYLKKHFSVIHFRDGRMQWNFVQNFIQINAGIPVLDEENGIEIEYIQARIPGV